MKNTHIIYLIALSVFFAACETTEVSLTTDTVVVDAYLYANEAIDSIRITKSNSYSDTEGTLVTFDNLSVSISNDTEIIPLTSIGGGYYQNLNHIVQAETTYQLSFEYNGEIISASTYIPSTKTASISDTLIYVNKVELGQMPTMTQIDPLEVTWNNDEGDYFYVVVDNKETEPEYIDERLATGDFNRPFRFITEPSIMNSYNIDVRRGIVQFGLHEVIVFRVNPEYATLYAVSGTTSSNITQSPSNIENGLGIFTGVSSDTLYLQVEEL